MGVASSLKFLFVGVRGSWLLFACLVIFRWEGVWATICLVIFFLVGGGGWGLGIVHTMASTEGCHSLDFIHIYSQMHLKSLGFVCTYTLLLAHCQDCRSIINEI